jgi:hypothetical protein
MRPTRCPACGGSAFEHDQFITGLVSSPRGMLNMFRDIAANCSVCLSCGHVSAHVDDAALEKLRARNPDGKGRGDAP